MGDLGQLPHTLVCVWIYGKHGGACGGEHLQGSEKDASRWPRNLSKLWRAMIEAENVLGGRRRPADLRDTEMKPILPQELMQMLVLLTRDERENITYSKLILPPLCVFCFLFLFLDPFRLFHIQLFIHFAVVNN